MKKYFTVTVKDYADGEFNEGYDGVCVDIHESTKEELEKVDEFSEDATHVTFGDDEGTIGFEQLDSCIINDDPENFTIVAEIKNAFDLKFVKKYIKKGAPFFIY